MKNFIKILVPILFYTFLFNTLAVQALKETKNSDAKLTASISFTSRKFLLGPNDILNVKFFGIPEFEQKGVKVQPDGNITIAPFGSIYVAGLTVDKLQEILEEKFTKYIKNPQITVQLVNSKSFIVYVSGAVMNPGSYEINTDLKQTQVVNNVKPEMQIQRKTPLLSNILVASGGVSYDADIEHIQIYNRFDKSKFEVNLFDLILNANAEQDIYLMAGDVVYIPRLATPLAVDPEKYKKFASATISPRAVPVKVYGYVNQPGLIKLDPTQSLNLNSAIMAAGGYLNENNKSGSYAPKKIYLSRLSSEGKLVSTVINPTDKDITLMPNDIIYVPDKKRPMLGKMFDYVGRLISPVNAFASTYNNWALMFDPQRYRTVR